MKESVCRVLTGFVELTFGAVLEPFSDALFHFRKEVRLSEHSVHLGMIQMVHSILRRVPTIFGRARGQ